MPDNLEAYLMQFNPMRRGKVRAALERQMRLDGEYIFRWQAAERLAARGIDRLDEARGRLYVAGGGFYEVSQLTDTLCRYALSLAARVSAN